MLAQQFLISGEDHRFFQHQGVDYIAVCRAIWRRFSTGKIEGASTIEMQIIRVISGRFERTLWRKIREMALATLLTHLIPKNELPAFYLQIAYYGWNMHGFISTCEKLRLNTNSLTTIETAQLVARLKYPQPRYYSPIRHNQIIVRGEHLLNLYLEHKLGKTYSGLSYSFTVHETI